MKEKAAEDRLWDEVKVQLQKEKARREVVVCVSSEEDSNEDSEEDSEVEVDLEEDTDWNTCLNLSCVVVFFFVSNLLILQYVLTRQV